MNEPNPYSAPDADLGTEEYDEYEPSIIAFDGRIGRLRYLAYSFGTQMALSILILPIIFILGLAEDSVIGMGALGLIYLGTFVLMVMYGKRRLNDLNRSGWWVLLFLVPLVNLILGIYVLFFPGTEGSNNFGPPAVPNTTGVKILAFLVPGLMLLGIVSAVVVPMLA